MTKTSLAKMKIAGFLLLVAILDFVVGRANQRFYYSVTASKNEKLIHGMMTSDEDILFFGSSRAQHHYVPDVFLDSSLLHKQLFVSIT